MKMYNLVLTFLFFYSLLASSLQAGLPTAESLFKNVSNPDVVMDGMWVELKISPIEDDDKTYYVKYNIIKKSESLFWVLQFVYNNHQMLDKHLVGFKHIKNYISELQQIRGKSDKLLYHSLLLSFLHNNAEGFKQIFANSDLDFKDNNSLFNYKKKRLWQKEIEYLEKIKANNELRDTLPSPLSPNDPYKKDEVKSILAEPTYFDTDRITLVKRNKKFFWELKQDKISAYFINDEKKLDTFIWDSPEGSIEVKTSDFVKLNGTHLLPKFTIFKTSGGDLYRVTFTKLHHYNNENSYFYRRTEKYSKTAQKHKKAIEHPLLI